MILVFGVFYLLLIRPQQRKQRQLQATIAELKAGDKVVTTGGIVGVVLSVKEKTLSIRSADAKFEITRSAVAEITDRGESSES